MAIIAKVALANTHVSFADSVNLAKAPARIEIATDIPINAPANVTNSALPAVIFLPLINPRMAVSSPKSNATAARDLPMFSGFTREIKNKEAAKMPIDIAIDLRTSALTLFWKAFSVSPAVLRTLVSALATPAQLVFIAANALAIFFICSYRPKRSVVPIASVKVTPSKIDLMRSPIGFNVAAMDFANDPIVEAALDAQLFN